MPLTEDEYNRLMRQAGDDYLLIGELREMAGKAPIPEYYGTLCSPTTVAQSALNIMKGLLK